MHVFLSLWGNSTSWSQHSNAKHRKQNGKRPSEVHRTASHTTLTDRDENVVDICHIFSCIFWLSHLLFSTSSRFSGQTWSLLWNCMIHTSWIQRIIMSWPIPGGRSGRKGFKSLLVPNPFRSVQCGMRLFFFYLSDYSYLMVTLDLFLFSFLLQHCSWEMPHSSVHQAEEAASLIWVIDAGVRGYSDAGWWHVSLWPEWGGRGLAADR